MPQTIKQRESLSEILKRIEERERYPYGRDSVDSDKSDSELSWSAAAAIAAVIIIFSFAAYHWPQTERLNAPVKTAAKAVRT